MLAMMEHITKYKDPKEAEKNALKLKVNLYHIQKAMKKIRPLSQA
jgi:hypothetical protein